MISELNYHLKEAIVYILNLKRKNKLMPRLWDAVQPSIQWVGNLDVYEIVRILDKAVDRPDLYKHYFIEDERLFLVETSEEELASIVKYVLETLGSQGVQVPSHIAQYYEIEITEELDPSDYDLLEYLNVIARE